MAIFYLLLLLTRISYYVFTFVAHTFTIENSFSNMF